MRSQSLISVTGHWRILSYKQVEGEGEGIDWISERINETDKGRKYVSLERGFSGD